MAIKIGQIRNDNSNISDYISEINHDITTPFENIGVGNTHFDDFAITGDFQANNTYYIRVLINRIDINENMGDTTNAGDNDPHNLNIDIKLYESNNASSSYQTIGEPILIYPYYNEGSLDVLDAEGNFIKWCTDTIQYEDDYPEAKNSIDTYLGASNYYNVLQSNYNAKRNKEAEDPAKKDIRIPTQTVELIFTPFKTAHCLVFQLRRVAYDYTIAPRVVSIVEDINSRDVAIVNNILPKIVKKIGLQTRPGSLVVINKEPMRIGKSGVLEINNGISITSVSMVAPLNQINDFILDYTYDQ